VNIDLGVAALRQAYAQGRQAPAAVLAAIRDAAAAQAHRNIWIHLLDEAQLQPHLDALAAKDPGTHPLWGIPFAIKDNIDLAGIPTTAACEAFAYTPATSAFVVQRLLDAGAIPVGKTNLDQFATGLNGTRSPWGACRNSFDADYISGGSSSGSAVAVALGLASFSLGSDTAGSGRVPACFNNLVGVKPTRGLLSATGLVPACRSLDTISIFALDADDANAVLAVAEGFDPGDGYSRGNVHANSARYYGRWQAPLVCGVIADRALQFFGDTAYERAYRRTLEHLAAAGVTLREIDYAPFAEAARLLYEGPWVAERYLAALPLIETAPDALLPVIRRIIEPGGTPRATDLFRAQYRLAALRQACAATLRQVDCLLTPTAGRLFTQDELAREPVLYNTQLGYYTNFMNLLDMAAVAVPTAFTDAGLPFGVTLAGAAFTDRALLSMANHVQQLLPLPRGATGRAPPPLRSAPCVDGRYVEVVVCGAHLSGLPLNWQLAERDGEFVRTDTTAACYRLYALPGEPSRPGLLRDTDGSAIDVEVWRLPAAEFGGFVAAIPAPLGIGKVELAGGGVYPGFVCEPAGVAGAQEITHLGGWRAYLQGEV